MNGAMYIFQEFIKVAIEVINETLEYIFMPIELLYEFSMDYMMRVDLDPLAIVGLLVLYVLLFLSISALGSVIKTCFHIICDGNSRRVRKKKAQLRKNSYRPKYVPDEEFEEIYQKYCS